MYDDRTFIDQVPGAIILEGSLEPCFEPPITRAPSHGIFWAHMYSYLHSKDCSPTKFGIWDSTRSNGFCDIDDRV